MVESRCGLKCCECDYKEMTGCKGCLTGDPFWGTCRLAACCADKGHAHCGLCAQVPCELFKEFAYDEEQGNNGQRIKNLKEWTNKKFIIEEKR
jgi:hypothetical protein